jgi:energy-coupling factor transporter transmembrane protein EcfT
MLLFKYLGGFMIFFLLFFVLIIWGAFLFCLGYFATFFINKKWLRFIFGILAAALLFTFPIRDELKGSDEFEALCSSGGVYQIKKSAEGKKFDLIYQATPYKSIYGYSRPVKEKTISFIDAASGEVIAVAKGYSAGGGWLVRNKILASTSINGPLIGRNECRPPPDEEFRRQKITNKLVN